MVNIRECTEADLRQVVRLSDQWARENITVGYEHVNWNVDKLKKRLNGYFYVAESDRAVIGYSFGEIREGTVTPVSDQPVKYLEIFEVYVEPAYRGREVGGQLIETLMARAHEQGIERILVGSSNKRWEDTVKFYCKHGFRVWYVQMYK
jgi:ribosomal protein S18 acetylase RimI-like enzyme